MELVSRGLLAAVGLLAASSCRALPTSKGLTPCPIDRDDLEKCIADNLNTYIPLLATAWSENSTGLDPLLIPVAESSYLDGNLTLTLSLKNVVIHGLSSTRVSLVRAKSLEEGKFEVVCKTPRISTTGMYLSEGVLVRFPLHSSGPFNVTLGDMTSHFVVHLESKKDHLQISDIGLNVMPSQIDVQAGKQMDDDNNLGVTLNVYLNENSYELYNLIRPQLMDYFAKLIKTIANDLLLEADESWIFPNLNLKK